MEPRREIHMRRICYIIPLISIMVMLSGPSAFATIVTTAGSGAGWQDVSGIGGLGAPYWAGASWDATGAGIGYYLTNSGAYTGSGPYSGSFPAGPGEPLQYWGKANGEADLNFYFDIPDEHEFTLKLKVTALDNITNGYDEFGYYLVDDPYTLHPILTTGDLAGAVITVPISGNFGFYITAPPPPTPNKTPLITWRTQSSLNRKDGVPFFTDEQHFAVFFNPDSEFFWIGVEDRQFNWSDKDYNDIGIKMASQPVPEPATLLLLGSGLIGLAGLARRRFRK
jgi:hypothetical protein